MRITHVLPAVLSCRKLHEHGRFETSWEWDPKRPLEVRVGILAPQDTGDASITVFSRREDLTLVTARELIWATVTGRDFAVRGTVGAVSLKIRQSMPNVMVVTYPRGVFMVQRDRVANFTGKTYGQLPAQAECETLDLDRLAARLQYST